MTVYLYTPAFSRQLIRQHLKIKYLIIEQL